jgi:hypothetical protein
MRSTGLAAPDILKIERKETGTKIPFIHKTNGLVEQRQNLPIYKVKKQLIKVNPFLELADLLFSTLNFVAD